MSCFNKVSTVTANSDLDLTKHVNYTSGMILGVDDFTQEFGYLAGRDRWLARDALGFGTVSGLQVTIEKDAARGARVMISPGVALSQRGQFICVPTAQCAFLNEWLAANKDKLDKRLITGNESPPAKTEVTLAVALCYRACPVDSMPIPGEPCRSEEELSAPSRIQDDFSLELRLDAPPQPEEDKLREFAEWLKNIKIAESGSSSKIEDFVQAVRDKWLKPPTSPPQPDPAAKIKITADDIPHYMRTAFRLWVTELRNPLSGRKSGCASEMTKGGDAEDCVSLGAIRVPLVSVSTGWKVSDAEDPTADEGKRPFVLHLRMIQEWMVSNFVRPTGPSQPSETSQPVSLDGLTDVEIKEPKDGEVVIFDGTKWINKKPTTPGGGTTDHGALVGLGDDDHTQYLLADGSRPMAKSLNAGANTIVNVKAGEKNGDAVIFEQAVKHSEEAKGDVTGKFAALTVGALQGTPVSKNKPKQNQILVFDGAQWLPQPQPEIPAPQVIKPQLLLPFATITTLTNNLQFEIWFNIDAPGNLARVVDFAPNQLQVFDETNQNPFISAGRLNVGITPTNFRNVFNCAITIQPILTIPGPFPTPMPIPGGFNIVDPDKLRFRFTLPLINVEITKGDNTTEKINMTDYAERNNIKFPGTIDGKTLTMFVRVK